MKRIQIEHLGKSFGPNQVLRDVELEFGAGELVGLMGPNGAGKSTLIKILGGIYSRSSGEIRYEGKSVRDLGRLPQVAFIHQDLGLVDDLSIADNLRLGEPTYKGRGPLLNRAAERELARDSVASVGLDCPVERLVGELSPGEKALVAVARSLQRGADVLFIDEATSTLPPGDSRRLLDSLRETVRQGATVVMVSHKLSEILVAAERVVVLLDGRVAADESAVGLDRERLAEMVLASESQAPREAAAAESRGEVALRMEGACGGGAGPVDLELRHGEAVGLTGLPGSGLHEIAYLAHGATKLSAGSVSFEPGTYSALVPPHRETQGGFASLSTVANMTISSLPRWRDPLRLLRKWREREAVAGMVEQLGVVPPDPEREFDTLSGGNKQKVIFGRVLMDEPSVYILCEPTRGVDVATRRRLYGLIEQIRDAGAAVLVVTSDFEDLFAVCDRIGVVEDGAPRELLTVAETSVKDLEAFV